MIHFPTLFVFISLIPVLPSRFSFSAFKMSRTSFPARHYLSFLALDLPPLLATRLLASVPPLTRHFFQRTQHFAKKTFRHFAENLFALMRFEPINVILSVGRRFKDVTIQKKTKAANNKTSSIAWDQQDDLWFSSSLTDLQFLYVNSMWLPAGQKQLSVSHHSGADPSSSRDPWRPPPVSPCLKVD